jgi:hypothetical protein
VTRDPGFDQMDRQARPGLGGHEDRSVCCGMWGTLSRSHRAAPASNPQHGTFNSCDDAIAETSAKPPEAKRMSTLDFCAAGTTMDWCTGDLEVRNRKVNGQQSGDSPILRPRPCEWNRVSTRQALPASPLIEHLPRPLPKTSSQRIPFRVLDNAE